MTQLGIVVALAATHLQEPATIEVPLDSGFQDVKYVERPTPLQAAFPIQFSQSVTGRSVRVLLDGRVVKTTSAGKLFFRDARGSGVSVCADVRAPIARGMSFAVTPYRSAPFGGNVAKAGNIVAKWFRAAQTADECAGLQLAVWEAIEDGGAQANFLGGRFQVQASPSVLAYAQRFYQANGEPGDALYLQAGQGGQGGSPGGGNGNGQSQITTAL